MGAVQELEAFIDAAERYRMFADEISRTKGKKSVLCVASVSDHTPATNYADLCLKPDMGTIESNGGGAGGWGPIVVEIKLDILSRSVKNSLL